MMHKNKQLPKTVVVSKQVQAKFDKVLIEDVVQHIFSYLPVRARAKFGEVSRQWKKISRRPCLWPAVEMAFISRADRNVKRKKDINSTRHLISLAAFLHKYCTSLEDLHLSYDHHSDMTRDRLDAFFQIKSLKRMRILELSPHDMKHEYLPSTIPACSNLELLNFDPYISVEATKKLFQGLKSLKELYVPYARIDFFNHKNVFSLATKLERLALKYYSMPADLLVKTCPSLRFIMYYRDHYAKDSDSDDDGYKPIEVIGNTVAVRPEGFESESFRENFKLLEPILVPYQGDYEPVPFLAALAADYDDNKEIIKYLVQEKKYDLHYECPQYIYRQSFQSHYASFSSSKPKFTLAAAIQGYWRDVESVQELLELGCTAECPKEGYSYLTHAERADVRMLLLQRGADPNKIAEVDLGDRKYYFKLSWMRDNILRAPAFAFHFMDPKFEDSEEFVLALKGRVDFNIEVHGETLLGWAIEHKKWNSIYALLKLGIRSVKHHSHVLTNGKVDEAKIRQAQMKEKAENDEADRQRQEINARLRKMIEEGNPPWMHDTNFTSSDEDRPVCSDEDSGDRENNLWGSNSDSEEHEHRNFWDMSSDGSHEEFNERSSSEVEESEVEEEDESDEEYSVDVRSQLPAKLQRLYDALVGIQKIIQDRESFSVKAFQKQLTSDIFPAYISNSNRKRQLKSATTEAESKDLFKALLKRWIEDFLTEFHHEIESMASK